MTLTVLQDGALEQQLLHEQKLAARYRYYVSVVMVAPAQSGISIRGLIDDTLRECDEMYVVSEGVAILMPHTTLEDATQAVERFKSYCADRIDLRFSIATYPTDDVALDLLSRAKNRLAEAKVGEFGKVVFQD
jgi:hypothetical protein